MITRALSKQGMLSMARRFLNAERGRNCLLHLYANDADPIYEDTVGRYTEVRGGGYVPISLLGDNWDVVVGTGQGDIVATYPEAKFTFTGAVGFVWGYYVTDSQSEYLLWAEKFYPEPFRIIHGGDVIRITVNVQISKFIG